MRRVSVILLSTACVLAVGCGKGKGTAKFTTWGEEYMEKEIPSDPTGENGFVDGWTLHYDKFLVTFHGIRVASSDGTVGATMQGSKLVDNTKKGRKDLVTFTDLEAKSWDKVSYQIKPATATSQLIGATEADRAMMVQKGYSVYFEGSATKTSTAGMIMRTFHLGFPLATQYNECQQPEKSGRAVQGIVVTEGGTDVSELTTHGDHPYYDRLKASPDPAVKTVLRFDEKATAAERNGEVTIERLNAQPIDVRKYDPSGFDAPTLGAFMTSLVRTIGHFKGEGECTISKAD